MEAAGRGSFFCAAGDCQTSSAHSSESDSSPVCWICRSGEDEDTGGGSRCGEAARRGEGAPGSSEPLIRDRCCCQGPLAIVHQSCIDRWVIEAGHSTCGLCGATYVVEETGSGSGAGGRRTWPSRLAFWRLCAQYFGGLLYVLSVCMSHCFIRFGVMAVVLSLIYRLTEAFAHGWRCVSANGLSDCLFPWWKGMELLRRNWDALFFEAHENVPLWVAGLCCRGWLVLLVGRYLQRSWRLFCHPREARQREAARRRWREGLRRLQWAGRWREVVRHWRQWSEGEEEERPRREFVPFALLAAMWGLVGLAPTAAVAAAAFCGLLNRHVSAPLVFQVDMDIIGVDLFDEGANAHRLHGANPDDAHQPPPPPRPLNQSRRRRFGRQNRIRNGVYRTCVVVRGANYAFLQREVVRWVHLGLAPLLTGIFAHLATSPILLWELDLHGGGGAGAGAAEAAVPSLAPSTVFATVPPSPFEALVRLGVALRSSPFGRGFVASVLHGLAHVVGFASSLSLYDVMGYWTAGVVVLWAATALVMRPIIGVTMSEKIVANRFGFCVTHPLDIAAVDRLVEFSWIRNNRRRESMGGASLLTWVVDTVARVLPQELWHVLCRCLSCFLLLLAGTSLVVACRLSLEKGGLVQSYKATAPGTAMEAQPLSLWRLPRSPSLPSSFVRDPAASPLSSPSPPPLSLPLSQAEEGREYTDAVGFTVELSKEVWRRTVPPLRAFVGQTVVQLSALGDGGTPSRGASGDASEKGRGAQRSTEGSSEEGPATPNRFRLPWKEWAITGTLLLWGALYLELYPWHYRWLRCLMPFYVWWGHSVLRLPEMGPRSVFCEGQQRRRLVRWLRACERRATGATASATTPAPQLYYAVGALLGWDPIRGVSRGPGGYPHSLRIRQQPNLNEDVPSLARFVHEARAKQREARRRVRAEELTAAAARRRGRDQRRQSSETSMGPGASAVPDPLPPPPPLPALPLLPQRERRSFATLPARYHHTVSDWLYEEIRGRFAARTLPHAAAVSARALASNTTPFVAYAPPPRTGRRRRCRCRGQSEYDRGRWVRWQVLRASRWLWGTLSVTWYEARVALFVAGALLGTAAYLGCVLALIFAFAMDIVPSCLLLVGLCGVVGGVLASPWTSAVTTASSLSTPVMMVVLLGLEAQRGLRWLWELLSGAPEQVQAVTQALHPTRLHVGPYRR